MNNDDMIRLAERAKDEGRSVLDGIIRQGAQKILVFPRKSGLRECS